MQLISCGLGTFLAEHGIAANEAVSVIRRECPRFDKPLLSKCRKPDEYGIRLDIKAENALLEAYGDVKRKEEKRIKNRRLVCRFTDYDYQRIMLVKNQLNYLSVQEFLSDIIKEYVEKHHDNYKQS